ncbi:MAG: DUF1428 domain-containing protein [Caulobacterales bacterium]
MTYVDGFVIAVPKKNIEAYREISQKCGPIWKEFGAIDYVECVGDDTPYGELTSFPRAVIAKEDEVVVFSWITYPSKEVRDECNKKVMEDPRMEEMSGGPENMPFDGKRMIFGGFNTIVQL